MKTKKEIMLVKALLNEMNEAEQNGFDTLVAKDRKAAQTIDAWKKIEGDLKNYHPDFRDGFDQAVLLRLAHLSLGQSRQGRIFHLMFRLTMSATAAVLLLLLYVIWQENSLTLDGLLGLAGLKSDDFTNLLANY